MCSWPAPCRAWPPASSAVVEAHEFHFVGILPLAGEAENILCLHEPLFNASRRAQEPSGIARGELSAISLSTAFPPSSVRTYFLLLFVLSMEIYHGLEIGVDKVSA